MSYSRCTLFFLKKLPFLVIFGCIQLRGVEIAVSPKATPVERNAAEILARHLKVLYQKEFPITTSPHAQIRIGAYFVNTPSAGREGFTIRSSQKEVVLGGGTADGRGNLYAVYEFLERLGFRFLTRKDTFVPGKVPEAFPVISGTFLPSFPEMRYIVADGYPDARFRATGLSSGYHTKGKGTKPDPEKGFYYDFLPYPYHTMQYFLPLEKYAQTNPDYYAMRGGKRLLSGQVELCFSNMHMAAEFMQNIRKYLSENFREGLYLCISQEDENLYCECAECSRINRMEKSRSGTLVRFLNLVAAALEKDYPNLPIRTDAYKYTRQAPEKTRLHKNICVEVCNIECDLSRAFDGYHENEVFWREVKKWRRTACKLHLGDYGTTFDNHLLPLPNFDALAERLRGLKSLGFTGVSTINAHSGPGGEFAELRNYLTAKLYWNCDEDPWRIAEDFCLHYYGVGGKHILAYIKWYHRYAKEKNVVYRHRLQPMHIYDRRFLEKARVAFRKAYAAVNGDPVFTTRLDRSHTALLMLELLEARKTASADAFEKKLDEFESECRRFGIRSVWEGQNTLSLFLDDMRLRISPPDFCRGREFFAVKPSAWLGKGWAEWISDPAAPSKKPVCMSVDHQAWAVYKNCSQIPGAETDVRYDVYACLKVEIIGKPAGNTPVLRCGYYHAPNTLASVISCKDLKPGYSYYKIADMVLPNLTSFIWFAPFGNPESVKHICIDHLIFIHRDS